MALIERLHAVKQVGHPGHVKRRCADLARYPFAVIRLKVAEYLFLRLVILMAGGFLIVGWMYHTIRMETARLRQGQKTTKDQSALKFRVHKGVHKLICKMNISL